MLYAILFSKYEFDSRDKTADFFEFLNQRGGPFAPDRFGTGEPVRLPFVTSELSEPIRLLSGQPEHQGGSIYLKGAAHKALSVIRWWKKTRALSWEFFLAPQFFNKSKQVEQFIEFVTETCEKYPMIYGWAAPEEDWEAKHWLVTPLPGGGTSREKREPTLEEGLPGIYWITIFGPELVAHFGLARLRSLPVYQVLDLGPNGIGIVLRESPFTPEPAGRLKQDDEIMELLGREYFFDINDPDKAVTPIPGLTKGNTAPVESQTALADSKTNMDPAEASEYQTVLSADGEVYTDPESLAETLVVYLHTRVKEVSLSSKASLEALDKYFSSSPQAAAYTTKHLMTEFIPALGAYLGQVIVKQLRGRWVIEEPLPRSSVIVGERTDHPFRYAYRCVYEGFKLTDFYDEVERSINRS